MYQVKLLQANQINALEELMNMWLKEQTGLEVVDIKFHSHSQVNGKAEYIAVMVYQQQI